VESASLKRIEANGGIDLVVGRNLSPVVPMRPKQFDGGRRSEQALMVLKREKQ
jgi:hypothetical protein